MNKQRTNLTLQPEILKWADQIMERRHYNSLSVLVEELIRERYDQLFGTVQKKDAPESEEQKTKKRRAA